MKKRGILFIISIGAMCLFQGCNIEQTVYLQNVNTSGPINQPPLHITSNDSSTITLSPKIFINTTGRITGQVDGHSKVNKNGIYQVDTIFNSDGTHKLNESKNNIYDFSGNNFSWSLPDASIGVDFDMHISKVFSFYGGINYSAMDQKILMGGSLGLGIYASRGHSGYRYDIGIMWQQMYYTVSSIVVTDYYSIFGPGYQDVTFFKDKDKFTAYNFYGTWSYNSIDSNLPFEYYFGIGLFGQTLIDFRPKEIDMEYYWQSYNKSNTRVSANSSYLMGMLGIYKNLDEHNRISFGLRVLKEFQIQNLSESLFIVPSIQMDMSF